MPNEGCFEVAVGPHVYRSVTQRNRPERMIADPEEIHLFLVRALTGTLVTIFFKDGSVGYGKLTYIADARRGLIDYIDESYPREERHRVMNFSVDDIEGVSTEAIT
jgi:hypothetical protein